MVFQNFRMIIFHYFKFYDYFCFLRHYVLTTKIFVEYLSFCFFFWFVLATELATTVVLWKVFLKFSQLSQENTCFGDFCNKVAGLKAATLLWKGLHQSCFPVNIAKFSRAASCMEHLRWLLLQMVEEFLKNSNLTIEGKIRLDFL